MSALPDGDFVPVSAIVADFRTNRQTVSRAIREGHISAIRHGARKFLVDRASAGEYFARPVHEDPIDAAAKHMAAIVAALPPLSPEDARKLAAILPVVGA